MHAKRQKYSSMFLTWSESMKGNIFVSKKEKQDKSFELLNTG